MAPTAPIISLHPDQSTQADAVRVEAVSRVFAGRKVLDRLNLVIRRGEFVALLGASGSGKTTLLRILAGLDAPDAGTAYVPEARTVVFQEPRLLQAHKVWRNVVVGLKGQLASRERALLALDEVGLARHVDAWPGRLSGGEAQRVALARALVREPQLLLLDEPFASLDALTRLKMQQLVDELGRRHGPATLLVTHDVDEAILLADRVLVLKDGYIAVDVQITTPRPRTSTGQTFDAFRARFLSELGVTSGEATHSASEADIYRSGCRTTQRS